MSLDKKLIKLGSKQCFPVIKFSTMDDPRKEIDQVGLEAVFPRS